MTEMIMKRQFKLKWLGVITLFVVMPLLMHMHISLPAAAQIGNGNGNSDDNGEEDTRKKGEIYDEFEVKAAILEKIAPFIEWPRNTGIDNTSKPFVIGVFGETPLIGKLEETYVHSQKRILEKPVEVRSISRIEEIPGCHLLFIPYAAKPDLPKIIKFVRNKSILTICDSQDFSQGGVHITLFIRGDRIMFNINKTAIKTSGLSASWHIMKNAAEIIDY